MKRPSAALISRRQFTQSASAGAVGALWRAGSLRAAEDKPLHETMQRARDAALEILKPSPKQLAHGLELHRQSIVFDVYGFAPRAALDGAALARAIEAGASDLALQDLREEMGMTRMVADDFERAEFQAAWQAAGMTCILQNAGEEGNEPLRLLKRLARFTYVTDRMREFVFKAVDADDIERAKKEERHCLMFTGNGVPLAGDYFTVDDELRYVRTFHQLGIRMMHVTYQRRNLLGDGCAEPANAGLSDFGRAAIREMNRLGIVVDVAHSGWRTSLEAAQASAKPMVASHTACDALNHHIRCKPAEVIKSICDTGGLVGICCIPNFLGGQGDITALLDHIDYVAQRFGVDHVAIGTDISHTSSRATDEAKKVPRGGPRAARYESFWPADALRQTYPGAVSIAWTNWPLFTVGLVQRGYRDADVQKILGQNMLRVLRAQG